LCSGDEPTKRLFGRLIEWFPVLEHLAYRCATRIGSLVDAIKYNIVESKVKDLKESEARLAQYWVATRKRHAHLLAHR
jgi:hypothetical protein